MTEDVETLPEKKKKIICLDGMAVVQETGKPT